MKNFNYLTKIKLLSGKFYFGITFLAMLVLVGIISCTTNEDVKPTVENPWVNPPILTRSPTAVSDRIYFADFNDFEDYYLELDSIYNYNEDMFDSIVLATSPVQTVNDLTTTNTSYSTWLSDPIMRAILNPYYEFQIDDVIVTYINNGELLAMDASNSTAKSNVRSVTKDAPIDIDNIPAGAYYGTPWDIDQSIKIGCGCRVYIEPSDDCENIRIYGRCNGLFGSDGDGDLTVSFNDGIFAVLTDEVNGNFEYFISTSNFPNSGHFDAFVDPDCVLASNATAFFNYDPATFALCDDQYRSTPEEIVVSGNGNERFKMKTSYFHNFWGYKHLAEIKSETWNGSSWLRSYANLTATVDANRQGLFCNFIENKTDTKNKTSARDTNVSVSWSSPCAHCDGDLDGTFVKVRSTITLRGSQSVNFECCGE